MLVRFDPATEKFQTWPILPSGGGVVRHIVVGPDGSLWLADSEVDAITKVEIKAATGTRSRPGCPPGNPGLNPRRVVRKRRFFGELSSAVWVIVVGSRKRYRLIESQNFE